LFHERFTEVVRTDLATGRHRNPTRHPGYFTTSYFHLPEDLYQEVHEAGFREVNLYAIEGPLWLSQAALERWADPALRERYLEAVR
jgi:hypothetical protein